METGLDGEKKNSETAGRELFISSKARKAHLPSNGTVSSTPRRNSRSPFENWPALIHTKITALPEERPDAALSGLLIW